MQLLEEFFRQGDKERALGLPFSPLCDRNNTLVAESQIGFIEFIVEPSMQVCSDMLETVLGPLNVKESVDESANGKRFDNFNNCTVIIQNIYIFPTFIDSLIVGSTAESNRFKIGKPWIQCLVENKQIWKEQAVRGMLYGNKLWILNDLIIIMMQSKREIFLKKINRNRKIKCLYKRLGLR